MPHHPPVGLEPFAEGLLSAVWPDEVFAADAHTVVVAEKAGRPAAFAHASFLDEKANYSDLEAGGGVLRFVIAGPQETDACRAVIRAIVEEAHVRQCPDLRALLPQYGPMFHNYGNCGLSNAWPWIGRCLMQEGFQTLGLPALAMYRRLDDPIERLPLPEGAELRYDWVTRIGVRDEWEGGHHLFFGDDRAAETMWYFGEKFVRGLGTSALYLFWLGANDPYRGRGLGRFLLREALATGQEAGARETCLRARMDNFFAHAIYRAEGYEPNDLLWQFQYRRE